MRRLISIFGIFVELMFHYLDKIKNRMKLKSIIVLIFQNIESKLFKRLKPHGTVMNRESLIYSEICNIISTFF